ncbi:MAG: aminotransferase class IV [Burkholderiaceae bacterium]|jgi:branched-subunit amino acid aminotransferase/4-amino-4-deoxychorismate lyase|nr:aminotransferase class IV [Burkholderiaceae bacterium]
MNRTESLFQYTRGGWHAVPSTHGEILLVADSFHVKDGMAWAPERHAKRFVQSCHTLCGVSPDHASTFWQAAMEHIPQVGVWFPRTELVRHGADFRLRLRLRRAPPQQTTARLWRELYHDQRKQPRHKGIDLLHLVSLRESAARYGADEGLLCTNGGNLLEGLTSRILWWEENVLCTTSPRQRVFPGITAALICEIAREKGIPVTYRLRRPAELDGCETWVVNAFHGIRSAVNWAHAPWRVPEKDSRSIWQEALDIMALRHIRTVW